MTGERKKELALKVCEEWSSFPLMRAKELIRTVAAEAREEGIDEMRDEAKTRAKRFSDSKRIYVGEPILLQEFDFGAEWLKEQGK